MLAKQHRLAKEKDFKKINITGRSFFTPCFKLKYLANKLEFSRFAIVASTKVSKKATQRNRLKRQLREIIRLNLNEIRTGYDIIIYLKSKALDQHYQELERQTLALLAGARLLK